MIHVIATIELRPGLRDEFLGEFRAIVPAVLAEAGCLSYGPTLDVASGIGAQPPARPDVVTIVESWEGLDHLKAHLAAPHIVAYRERVKDMVLSTTLSVLEPA
jgi:quinol monooxygenase YgiN